jgi:hypothetical protein
VPIGARGEPSAVGFEGVGILWFLSGRAGGSVPTGGLRCGGISLNRELVSAGLNGLTS